ncbi:YlxR family protein [Campylobacter coli]|nr:YlxR family protein [Campylobacter coli]
MLKKEKKRYNFTKDKHEPIRMCIVCKNRYLQKSMYRFKHFQGELYKDFDFGRSVYLCETCILSEGKVLQKAFFRSCKNLNTKITQQNLKEIVLNGKN